MINDQWPVPSSDKTVLQAQNANILDTGVPGPNPRNEDTSSSVQLSRPGSLKPETKDKKDLNRANPFSKAETDHLMQLALQEASLAEDLEEVPVGALVVDQSGSILGKGHNQPISSHDPTAHAEVIAIREAGGKQKNYRLPSTILITTLEPCIMCLGAMIQARISGLIFGALDPKNGAIVSRFTYPDDFLWANHQFWHLGQIRAKECTALLKVFFQRKRKKYAPLANDK